MSLDGSHAYRAFRIAAALMFASGPGASPGQAADPAVTVPPAALPSWEITVAAYGWASGLSGDAATMPPAPAIKIDIGFDKVIRNLEGALMAAGEFRYDRYLVVADVLYARLGNRVSPRGPLFDSARLETSSFTGTLAGGYRLVDDARFSLDALAGIRATSVWTEISTTSRVAALNRVWSETETWVDPIVGVKMRFNIDQSWYLIGWGSSAASARPRS